MSLEHILGHQIGEEYAEEFLAKKKSLEKAIAEDGDFLSKIGTPGHTKSAEEDARTMQLIGARIRRNKLALEKLNVDHGVGQNLDQEKRAA
ncbi:MAG: hypothetical protein WC814_00185 [Candidatus Paceibacterota bacterium]|jgi:hypothetical protein